MDASPSPQAFPDPRIVYVPPLRVQKESEHSGRAAIGGGFEKLSAAHRASIGISSFIISLLFLNGLVNCEWSTHMGNDGLRIWVRGRNREAACVDGDSPFFRCW